MSKRVTYKDLCEINLSRTGPLSFIIDFPSQLTYNLYEYIPTQKKSSEEAKLWNFQYKRF